MATSRHYLYASASILFLIVLTGTFKLFTAVHDFHVIISKLENNIILERYHPLGVRNGSECDQQTVECSKCPDVLFQPAEQQLAPGSSTQSQNQEQNQDSLIFAQGASTIREQQGSPNANPTSLASTEWSPLVLTTCASGMPKFWAPCIQAMNPKYIETGEELIFPDYEIAYPMFPDSKEPGRSAREQKDKLRAMLSARDDILSRNVILFPDKMVYRGQHGQNIVVRNGMYSNDPPADVWQDNACMGKQVTFIHLTQPVREDSNASLASSLTQGISSMISNMKMHDSAIITTSPDSWSFQHFLDRVTHIMEQASHLMDEKTKVITRRKPSKNVEAMYGMLGYGDNILGQSDFPVEAKRLIFSCRAPLLHPWFALRFQERMNVNRNIPISQRKDILLLSRHGKMRGITNELELQRAIESYLAQRSKGEILFTFANKQAEHNNFADMVHYLNTNVKAIIGPHGGAFYNHRFCAQNTLIIELMPDNRMFTGIWEEAFFLYQHYFMFLLPASTDYSITLAKEDISAIMDEFKRFFEANDVKEGPMVGYRPVTASYDWLHKPEGEVVSPSSRIGMGTGADRSGSFNPQGQYSKEEVDQIVQRLKRRKRTRK